MQRSTRTAPTTIRLHIDVDAEIRALAEREHRTFTDQLRYLVDLGLKIAR